MAEQKERVGERIRVLREQRDWSQSELARKLPGKVDGPSVSRWELGKVYPEQYLDALAQVFEVDVSYFLVADPQPGTGDLMGAFNGDGPDDLAGLVLTLQREISRLSAQVDRLTRREGEPPEEAGPRGS